MSRYRPPSREDQLHQKICNYLLLAYPSIIFRTDLGGIRLTMGQAAKVKRLQGGRRAWPDLFIAEVRGGSAGLFIELKDENAVIYKKDGSLRSNPHIEEQAAMLQTLREKGYKAEFAVGFEAAKELIDSYLA